MNREIKFRAWDKTAKEMRKVMSLDFYTTRQSEATLTSDGDAYLRYFDDIELMQYTGFKDVNRVEIYEGDIVTFCDFGFEFSGGMTNSKNHVCKVIYELGSFYLVGKDYNDFLSHAILNDEELEVIGNIYENKELLGVTR